MLLQAALEAYLWDYRGSISLHCSGCLLRQHKHVYLAFCHSSPSFDKITSTPQLSSSPCILLRSQWTAWVLPGWSQNREVALHCLWDWRDQHLTQTHITVVTDILLFAETDTMVTFYRKGSMPSCVPVKLLLLLTVPRSEMSKWKSARTQNGICWQSLGAARKLKKGKKKTEDWDRGCRCTPVVRMNK